MDEGRGEMVLAGGIKSKSRLLPGCPALGGITRFYSKGEGSAAKISFSLFIQQIHEFVLRIDISTDIYQYASLSYHSILSCSFCVVFYYAFSQIS